jgi:hypothetical protein
LEKKASLQFYNQGVALYRNRQFHEAIAVFGECFRLGEYQPQSAYSRTLCQNELGLKIELPSEMRDLAENIKTIYVASNLAGYLVEQGHQAALTQQGSACQLETRVNGVTYIINIANVMGKIIGQAWRREGIKPIDLTNSRANPDPSANDHYIIRLATKAAQLPPAFLPESGLEEKLP